MLLQIKLAHSAGTVEYTDCFSAEGLNPPNECPGYDTKQSDDEVPAVLGLWGSTKVPLQCHRSQVHSGLEW